MCLFSQIFSNFYVVMEGVYRVCWCPRLGANCDAAGEFVTDAGTFTSTGPQPLNTAADLACTFGVTCYLALTGTRMSGTNRLVITGDGDEVMPPNPALPSSDASCGP